MKVAIVGGGVIGLSTAYFLAKAGVYVDLFEQRYLLYGASGRNSGGITAQLRNKSLIKLALRSLELYGKIQSEVKFNFLLRKSGYLKVAAEKDVEKLKEEVKFQRKCGANVEFLEADNVARYFSDINTKAFSVASYFAEGGVVFPWPVIWGLAKGCKGLGVNIHEGTSVKVVVERDEAVGVKVNGETHKADYVVNAAGAWSNEVSKTAGVELSNRVVREEICVTESLRPYIDPYIFDISSGVYVSQSMRGEVVGGIEGKETDSLDTKSTLDFLIEYSKKVTQLIPKLRGLSILRQWTGIYDVGKNGLPVGFTKVKGFVQANGFGRYGMSVGLAAGESISELIIKGKSKILEEFSPDV